jgi:selenocysteine lyase/cysteine desulfurase
MAFPPLARRASEPDHQGMPTGQSTPTSSPRAFEEWEGRGAGYLNAAAYGLPPRSAIDASRRWIDEWSTGVVALADWLPATDLARESFARLVRVEAAEVATGTSVSQLVALIAASLPSGALVLAPENEFTSLLYPFLAQADRGVRVELVPCAALADATADRADVVAFSLVGSASGRLADWRAIADAAAARGALTVVDAAQACGWLDADYARFDALVCPAFKWLCSPRGTAFLRLTPSLLKRVRPIAAGWWASVDARRFYGGPLELAADARRLDVSPVWTSWAGTAAALRTLEDIGTEAIAAHALRLANRLRAGLGQPPGETPIVIAEGEDSFERLTDAGIVTSRAATGARLALHAFNDDDDVDRAHAALRAR